MTPFLQYLIILGLATRCMSLTCYHCGYVKVVNNENPKDSYLDQVKTFYLSFSVEGCSNGNLDNRQTITYDVDDPVCYTQWQHVTFKGRFNESETMTLEAVVRNSIQRAEMPRSDFEWIQDGCRNLMESPFALYETERHDGCFCKANLCNKGTYKELCPPEGFC